MKTKTLIILILTILTGCISKQFESLPSYGLLWRITGNGLEKPSYLLGTFHEKGGMQILDSIKCIDSIFNTTEQLLCETRISLANLNNHENDKVSTKFEQLIKPWPVNDSTYDNILSMSQKKILDSVLLSDKMLTYIKQANLRPLSLLNHIQYAFNNPYNKIPKVVSNDYKQSDTTHVILDLYLESRAVKRNMNIVALDLKEELRMINEALYSSCTQLSYRKEVDILMYYIENHSTIDSKKKSAYTNALSVYLKQDIGSMFKPNNKSDEIYSNDNPILLFVGKDFYYKYNTLIINERNNNWIKKIPDLIAEKSSFIAVGAAHLAGKNGLINQLRNLGYDVHSFKENIQ